MIKKLAFGDMIILNVEYSFQMMRPRNCGPCLIEGVHVCKWNAEAAVSFGSPCGAIAIDHARNVTISNSKFERIQPEDIKGKS
jgi:hypothetical protein